MAHRPPPPQFELARLEEALVARAMAGGPDAPINLHNGSWMSPREHVNVLHCQLRSLSMTNPYVEVSFLYFVHLAACKSGARLCQA